MTDSDPRMSVDYIINKTFGSEINLDGLMDSSSNSRPSPIIHCLLCERKLKSGRRRDVKIRHLAQGCRVFHDLVSPSASVLDSAKKYADELFGFDYCTTNKSSLF